MIGRLAGATLPGLIKIANNPIVRMAVSNYMWNIGETVHDKIQAEVTKQMGKTLRSIDAKLGTGYKHRPTKKRKRKK